MERAPSEFGRALQRYMAYMELSQSGIAEALERPRQTLNGYMPHSQVKSVPTYAALLDIADKLGVDLDWLCGRLQSEAPVWSPAIHNAHADVRLLAGTITVANSNERVMRFFDECSVAIPQLAKKWFRAGVLGLDDDGVAGFQGGKTAFAKPMGERLERLTGVPQGWFLSGNAAFLDTVLFDGDWPSVTARAAAAGFSPARLNELLSAIEGVAASLHR